MRFENTVNCNKEDNSFHTIKNFDRNRIVICPETAIDELNKAEAAHWLELAKETGLTLDKACTYPEHDRSHHYYKFKPFIKFFRENLSCNMTWHRLMDVKEEMYKKHCAENRFWIDVRNKELFSKLPNVIGILVEDKFMVMDGWHRCTLYCIDDSLSLNFDCL